MFQHLLRMQAITAWLLNGPHWAAPYLYRQALGWVLLSFSLLASFQARAQADSTYSTACFAYFGPLGHDYLRTYAPATAGNVMFVSFPQYYGLTEGDTLYAYDGASSQAPLIGTYFGNIEGQTITATNPGGLLTIRFITTSGENQSDFEGEVKCIKPIQSTDVIMSSTPVTTAGGKFYHPHYPASMLNSDNITQTLTPATPGAKLKVKFDSFYTGGRYMGTLYVYDGPSTSSPLIGAYRTLTPIFAVKATNPTGQLTFKMVGTNIEYGNSSMGWDATISYVNEECPSNLSLPATIPPLIDENHYHTTIQASPAGNYRYTLLDGAELTDRNQYDFNAVTGELKLSYPYDGNVIVIRATNENGCFVDKSYTLKLACPTITFPASLPAATVQSTYSASVAVTTTGTYTYSLVPSTTDIYPFSLNEQTGEIGGDVPFKATRSFVVRATEANGCYADKAYTLTSTCPATFINPPNGKVGVRYQGDVEVQSLGYYVSVSESGMPEGMYPGFGGSLEGIPTQAGTYTLYIGAIAEEQECYVQGTVQLVIEPAAVPVGTSKVRLNCGGSDFKVANGLTFKADAYFSGLTKNSLTGGEIAGTVNDALYYTDRVADVDKGSFQYQIPVTNGKYQVNLFLAETYFTAAGKRVMSVKAEGNPILTNYDIFAAQGKRSAKMLSYIVTVNDGNVTLDFSASVNRPKINAIEIVPAPASAARQEGESELETELTTLASLSAYPNPFADQTSIRFTVPASGKASIAVYDLSGSLVKGLFEGELEAGVTKELTLDGAALPSGIYLVKATSSAGVSHLKLVLTK